MKNNNKKKGKQRNPVQVPDVSSTSAADETVTAAAVVEKTHQPPAFYNREPLPRKQLLIKFGSLLASGARLADEAELEKKQTDNKWYSMQYPEISDSECDRALVIRAEAYAANVMKIESDLYHEIHAKQNPGDTKWMKTVVAGGTLSDQVAALTMLIQDSPLHNLTYLRTLISKVVKHNRREALAATDSLKDLLVQELLPPDRKLVPLKLRPLCEVESFSSGNKDTRDRRLLLWYFESQLKELYDLFVRTIEKWCHDTVDATRLKSTRTLLDLLTARPEQEQFLLAGLVNKLGDKAGKVASKVVHFLVGLVDEHPNMRHVVADQVNKLIYRPNVPPRAQHYAVCFLAQVTLSRRRNQDDAKLAAKLLGIYFNLFKLIVKRADGGSVDNKLLAVLLKGTNKAFPLCTQSQSQSAQQILAELDTLYKVAAMTGNFNTSVQTLLLLHQTLQASSGLTDRFYSAVYRKLIDPSLLLGSSSHKHQPLFFHLLYQVMNRDAVDRRVMAFVKRLLQSALCAAPTFAVAALVLLGNLLARRPALRRVRAWDQQQKVVDMDKTDYDYDDDEEEEHFTDVHLPESDVEQEEETGKKKKEVARQGWVHRDNVDGESRVLRSSYDPSHRNPSFAGADCTLLYELGPLTRHYHPTVSMFANNLLRGLPIHYPGDPLEDFSLIRFLDRFVYRNPKKVVVKNESGGSVPMRKRKSFNPWGVKSLAVTSDEYIERGMQDQDQVPVDEQYLFKYMSTAGRPADGGSNSRAKKRKAADQHQDDQDDSDLESVASDEFEKLLEKFEPGAKNDEFDIDFSKDMAGEERKRKRKRRKGDQDDEDEDSDVDVDELFDVDPDEDDDHDDDQ